MGRTGAVANQAAASTSHASHCLPTREAVTQRMAARRLGEGCLVHGGLNRALDDLLVQVVAHQPAAVGVVTQRGGGKQVLPAPANGGIGKLPAERPGQANPGSLSAAL